MGRRDGSLRSISRSNRFDVFGWGMSSSLSEGAACCGAQTYDSKHIRQVQGLLCGAQFGVAK
jgi:hypothetical protein